MKASDSTKKAAPEPSWFKQFGDAFMDGWKNTMPGIQQAVEHPLDTAVSAAKGLPATVGGIIAGDPQTLGSLASQLPPALIEGGAALAPEGTGAVAGGILKGGWKGGIAPASIKIKGLPGVEIPGLPASLGGMTAGAAAGYELSHVPGLADLGLPLVGAAYGGIMPIVKGMVTGGKEAVSKIVEARSQAALRGFRGNPAWKDNPAIVPPTGLDLSSIPATQFPSGRISGSLEKSTLAAKKAEATRLSNRASWKDNPPPVPTTPPEFVPAAGSLEPRQVQPQPAPSSYQVPSRGTADNPVTSVTPQTPTSPVPLPLPPGHEAFLNQETSGLQIPQEVNARERIAQFLANELRSNKITTLDLKKLSDSPEASSFFRSLMGQHIYNKGITTQKGYIPSLKTMDRTMDILDTKVKLPDMPQRTLTKAQQEANLKARGKQ